MAEKNLFAAQIAYNDSALLIECLLNSGITFDIASNIIDAIEDRKINGRKYNKETWNQIKIVLTTFKVNYYRYNDFNIMLSKLSELVVLEKDLYLKLENEKKQVKTKK